MNIMTGCLSPTDGTVKIGGFDILEQPEAAKKLIGYLPEQPPLYPNETPQEYLTFVGEAKGLRGKELREEIDSAVQSAGIENVRDRLIGTLSKGYRQRVGIAQALLGKPQVIILDEPTVGLDPIQIIEIRDFIKELGKTHTIILSSHILSEVQAVCEQVLIISKGRLVAFDTPENLEKLLTASSGITFQVEAGKEPAEEILAQLDGLSGWDISETGGICSVTANLVEGQDAKAVCGKLTLAFAVQGLPVIEMRMKRQILRTCSSNSRSPARRKKRKRRGNLKRKARRQNNDCSSQARAAQRVQLADGVFILRGASLHCRRGRDDLQHSGIGGKF